MLTDEQIPFAREMIQLFMEGEPGDIILEINFEKVDGSQRTLYATNRIPESEIPKDVHESKLDLSTHARVFDKEAQGWRTIILKNINSITVQL